MRSLGLGLWSLSAVLVASAAAAAPVSPVNLAIRVGDYYAGQLDETQLGCSPGSGETFNCLSTTGYSVSDLRIDSWSMTFDADPVISGIVAVTNVGVTTQQFTLTFTLPTSVGPLTTMGGSIQGGVTDITINSSNALLETVLGSSFYTALIDTVSVQTLHNHYSFAMAPYDGGSAPVAVADFGLPGFTQPGPIVNSSIGIRLDFTLSPGDSASFTSSFIVLPVPEPGTGLLLACGLGVLALRRRR
jgi:hypothetical protein